MNKELKGLTFEQCQRLGLEPAHFYFETEAQSEYKTRRALEFKNTQEVVSNKEV